MFFSYLAAALRNLARSLYASISIAALAIGICAVMLMPPVVRNEYGCVSHAGRGVEGEVSADRGGHAR
jgi:hypothetical protein